MPDPEKIKILRSAFYPILFVTVLWILKGADILWSLGMNEYGLYPQQIKGLPGILTSPLLHSDFAHLFANSVPLLILGTFLFYFYKEIAGRCLFWLWLITGFWVWALARGGAAHIGASGIVYGLASFLIFSGIIRRESSLMVLTLLVTFLYGGLLWGVFPQFYPNQPISWESHLMGFIAGGVLAIFFRKQGPQRKPFDWEDEEDDEAGDDNGGQPPYWQQSTMEDPYIPKPGSTSHTGKENTPSSPPPSVT